MISLLKFKNSLTLLTILYFGKCVLDEVHKILYSFFSFCPFCKMISLLNFQRAANSAVAIYLKRQQFFVKVIWQIKE